MGTASWHRRHVSTLPSSHKGSPLWCHSHGQRILSNLSRGSWSCSLRGWPLLASPSRSRNPISVSSVHQLQETCDSPRQFVSLQDESHVEVKTFKIKVNSQAYHPLAGWVSGWNRSFAADKKPWLSTNYGAGKVLGAWPAASHSILPATLSYSSHFPRLWMRNLRLGKNQ